jgi:protein SCO1
MNTRREWMAGATTAMALPWWAPRAIAHSDMGPVSPPKPAPSVRLIDCDDRPIDFARRLHGSTTAVQLMFTGCSATCPIQGAIFADSQTRLAAMGGRLRLMSISVDPLNDDPRALSAWLRRFGADRRWWSAASPRMPELDRLLDFLRGRATGVDRHATQVYVFNRKSELTFRTDELPSPKYLAELMQMLDARA